MILIEKVWRLIRRVARFFVWFITARDCEHCANRYVSFLSDTYGCKKDYGVMMECIGTVTRCHFERRKYK